MPGEEADNGANGEETVTIDKPGLRHVTDLAIDVEAPLVVGRSGFGVRRTVAFAGGVASGPVLSGRVLPGVDYQLIRADGTIELHARYVIETEDGARVYVENTGLRSGAPEALARLNRGEPVEPSEIYFRAAPRFETGAAKLEWLMSRLFIATGVRRSARVELSVYEIL